MEPPVCVATGVPQLDLILGGGIVQSSLMLLAGAPGSGKTVLASQIGWAAAARGERVLFITAFSEPHNKLITNLRTFHFFDQDRIGGLIKLVNLQHQIANSTEEAADTIVREAREHKAALVIFDGFQGVEVTSQGLVATHQFLYDLSAKLSLLGITGVITYDLSSVPTTKSLQMTAVDSILLMTQELIGDHALRMLQVVKQRGSAPLLGRHSFAITPAGVMCYPRQESVTEVKDVPPGTERITFGMPELDAMLGGGLTQGTNTIIAGAEGVGKTLLGLQYVMQAAGNGEQAVFITFHETPQQLALKGRLFGMDVQTALDAGHLIVLYHSPADLNADMVAQALRDAVSRGKVQRLVIDGLYEIERPLIERGRAHGFFASLITFLRSNQITSCITLEIDPIIERDLSFVGKALSALADNVLLMRRIETERRLTQIMGVLKMRFSNHDRMFHEYTIDDQGLNVARQAAPEARTRPRRSR